MDDDPWLRVVALERVRRRIDAAEHSWALRGLAQSLREDPARARQIRDWLRERLQLEAPGEWTRWRAAQWDAAASLLHDRTTVAAALDDLAGRALRLSGRGAVPWFEARVVWRARHRLQLGLDAHTAALAPDDPAAEARGLVYARLARWLGARTRLDAAERARLAAQLLGEPVAALAARAGLDPRAVHTRLEAVRADLDGLPEAHCPRTATLRADLERGVAPDPSHLDEDCAACARALATDAFESAGLGLAPAPDEARVALRAAGLARPAELRELDGRLADDPYGEALAELLDDELDEALVSGALAATATGGAALFQSPAPVASPTARSTMMIALEALERAVARVHEAADAAPASEPIEVEPDPPPAAPPPPPAPRPLPWLALGAGTAALVVVTALGVWLMREPPAAPAAPIAIPTAPTSALPYDAATKVVEAARPRFAACRDGAAGVRGTALLVATVEPSGAVRAPAAEGDFAPPPVGACLRRVLAKLEFPRFEGAPVRLEVPLRL